MANKRKTGFAWAALLLLLLCACGADHREIDSDPKMTVDYGVADDGSPFTRYNGDAQEFFAVKSGKENVVEVTVHRESGLLRVCIQSETEPRNVVYEGNTFPEEPFTVTVKEAGRYRIWVHAENFIGSYHFTYDKMQTEEKGL